MFSPQPKIINRKGALPGGMIILNLKTYQEATGPRAKRLAEICAKVAKETGVRIVVAPQLVDMQCIRTETEAEIFAQHVDGLPQGKYTGWVSAEAVKGAGAIGAVINHAEHQLDFEQIKKSVARCKELGLETCVCADSIEIGERIKQLEPTFIAIEATELIGGDISIATAKPEVVKGAVKALETKKTKVIAGAGIKTGEDVRIALKLGAKGIILASGVVLAEHPEAVLREFAKAFK
jgi:triosephosphate isomerase